jgi:Ethanolamine utilization protein EutJ (predicted chaperonin)
MNKIVKDINEMSVFQIEELAKVLRIGLVINNGNEVTIIREEKENV